MIAADYSFVLGEIAETKYVIPRRVEDMQPLLGIIETALTLEYENTGNEYVLYDEYGKLTLKAEESMYSDLLIDNETCERFEYCVEIAETYNEMVLYSDNSKEGQRKIHMVEDMGKDGSKKSWGILRNIEGYYGSENGRVKAANMLKLCNKARRLLKVKQAFGDTRIRAGSRPFFRLGNGKGGSMEGICGRELVNEYLTVESCVHVFSKDRHSMDLSMEG
jgi:hypothetical protein